MRVCLVSTSNFRHPARAELIQSLANQKVEVFCVAPPGRHIQKILNEGGAFIPWSLDRRSLNPIKELKVLFQLIGIYRSLRPDIVHHFEHKACIYGGIASRIAGIRRVFCTLPGLGYVFSGNGIKRRLLQEIILHGYKFIGRINSDVKFTFSNQGHRELFLRRRVIREEKTFIVAASEGVNCSYFAPGQVSQETITNLKSELGIPNGVYVVAMVARMLWDKGVAEYVECARRIKAERSDVISLLIGPPDEGNPAHIPLDVLHKWHRQGIVQYLGKRHDIRELMTISDIIVLPSSYAEGLPIVLLEASSMEKAIVATNIPGCRELIEHMVNGILVDVKDVDGLVNAIKRLLDDYLLRKRLGKIAREIATERFDKVKIVSQILKLYSQV